jgi:predicted HTH transcriptional regulator
LDDPITDLDRLVLAPEETLEVEYKEWLDLETKSHKAKLAKELIALANHGGGQVVLGFSDPDMKAVPRPSDYPRVSADDVNGIVAAYADPPFHCRVTDVRGHLVISVPAGATLPVRAKKGSENGEIVADRYYIRRPGPNSEAPRSGLEWDELLRRCIANRDQELEAMVRRILRITHAPGSDLQPKASDPIDDLLK